MKIAVYTSEYIPSTDASVRTGLEKSNIDKLAIVDKATMIIKTVTVHR